MRYLILFLSIFIFISSANANELEFGTEWYGAYDDSGRKILVGFSGSNDVSLTIYVDKKLITRLKFYPEMKIRHAEFDGKEYKINYNSLYGYDHWIRHMKKHYTLRIWFEGKKNSEVFLLKGVSAGIKWLHTR